MKTHDVVIKMTIMVLKKCKFAQYSPNWQEKLKFFEIFLKIHSTKPKNVFENLKHISFVTWAVTKTKISQFDEYFWRVRRLKIWMFDVQFNA